MVGIVALAIPGLGPFIAGGPHHGRAGAAGGAAAGGLTGALISGKVINKLRDAVKGDDDAKQPH